ncbi:MAG TPA: cytochrome c3 family protein [Candidatus Acidoferrales bacterium]|nr:cytochrome c3 family protein [Candidatus Acidoferrales bacterium]
MPKGSEALRKMGGLVLRGGIVLGLFGFAILGSLQLARTAEENASYQAGRASRAAGVSEVFTPAHENFLDGVKDFFLWQPTPVQPIAFNHRVHVEHDLQCSSCHAGVTQGPDAGIPSVALCMACHQVIAADHPEIKKLAAYAARGEEVPWQKVYWFYPSEHVKFLHEPHVRAGVACEECHGDIAKETVAMKTKNLSMNFCLSCHNAKGVSVDCTTCHY